MDEEQNTETVAANQTEVSVATDDQRLDWVLMENRRNALSLAVGSGGTLDSILEKAGKFADFLNSDK